MANTNACATYAPIDCLFPSNRSGVKHVGRPSSTACKIFQAETQPTNIDSMPAERARRSSASRITQLDDTISRLKDESQKWYKYFLESDDELEATEHELKLVRQDNEQLVIEVEELAKMNSRVVVDREQLESEVMALNARARRLEDEMIVERRKNWVLEHELFARTKLSFVAERAWKQKLDASQEDCERYYAMFHQALGSSTRAYGEAEEDKMSGL